MQAAVMLILCKTEYVKNLIKNRYLIRLFLLAEIIQNERELTIISECSFASKNLSFNRN